jgi:phage-related protein
MEFFIPGVFLLLMSMLVTYLLVPHLTPFITAILSIVFLTFGVYTHYTMFESEYRLSTWQDGLKIYAPAVMIIAIILFIIYGIIALFTGVSVPIPSLPEFEMPAMPAMNSITNSLKNTYNNVRNNIEDATDSVTNSITDTAHELNDKVRNVVDRSNNNNRNNRNNNTTNTNRRNKPITESVIEAL